jgi:Holliday junction resolvase RusA-like endonuclease
MVRGKFPTVYMPSEYTAWKKQVAAFLKSEVLEQFTGTGPALEGPVYVHISVFIQKPKTSKLQFPKPDVDNYAKSIMDAVTDCGAIWDDDCQVQHLTISKEWAGEDDEPGFILKVSEL